MTTETYIYLNEDDLTMLKKEAFKNQLSISTTCNIIIKQFLYAVEQKTYTKKGKKQIHIKVRNECNYPLNTIIATNCIYAYYHDDGIKINKENPSFKRKARITAQNEMRRTQDDGFLKNILIRENYRYNKLKEKGQI